MKSLREQFEENYVAVPCQKKNGGKIKIRYEYDGPWYRWNLSEKELKSQKRRIVLLSLAGLGLFVATALLPAKGNLWSPTAIAGLFSLAAHVLELFGVLRWGIASSQVTCIEFRYVHGVLGTVPWVRGVCLLATGMCTLVFLVISSLSLAEAGALAGYLLCAGMAFALGAAYKKIPFTSTQTHSLQEKNPGS